MKRRFLRPGFSSAGLWHSCGINFGERVRSSAALVRRKFTTDVDAWSKPSASLPADNFIVCGERLNGVRELNGKEAAETERRRERWGRTGRREERAKKPIICENTAGCHPQNLPERDDRTTRFALYHSFPSWRLLRGETASPFRDFMTNLFDDCGTS